MSTGRMAKGTQKLMGWSTWLSPGLMEVRVPTPLTQAHGCTPRDAGLASSAWSQGRLGQDAPESGPGDAVTQTCQPGAPPSTVTIITIGFHRDDGITMGRSSASWSGTSVHVRQTWLRDPRPATWHPCTSISSSAEWDEVAVGHQFLRAARGRGGVLARPGMGSAQNLSLSHGKGSPRCHCVLLG